MLFLFLFSSKQCIIKQLLDSVFVISRIIKVSAPTFGWADITLTSTLIIPAITKTSSDNCLLQAEKGSDLNRFYGRFNRLDFLLLILPSKYRTLLCIECCLFEFITFLRLVFSWGFRLPQLYWAELSSYVTVLRFLSSEDIITTTITIITTTVIMGDIITTIVGKWPFLPLCLSWALLHSVLESGQRFAPV